MRRVGIVLGVALLVVVAILVAGYVALQRVDWNRYKQPVAEAVHEATGRSLDLGGALDLEIGLRPGVRIEQVAFANADWGSRPQMATLDALVVRVQLLPLLGGEVVVDRVELAGLDVLLETRADGAVNWDFEPPAAAGEPAAPDARAPEAERREPPAPEPPGEAPEPAPGGAPGSSPPPVRLNHLEIRDAVIVLRDQKSGEEQRIAVARLVASTTADSADAPVVLELEAAYDDEPIALSGQVTGLLAGEMSVDLKLETVGAVLDAKGGLGDPRDALDADLALRLEAPEIARLGTLAGAELPALPPLELSTGLRGGGDVWSLRDLALSLGTTQIGGQVDVALGGQRPRVDARLRAPRIDLADLQDPAAQARRVRAAPGIQLVAEERPEPLFSRDPLPLDGLSAVDARVTLDAELLKADTLELSQLGVALGLEDARLSVDRLVAGLARGQLDLKLGVDASQKPPGLRLGGTTKGVRVGDLAAAQGNETVSEGPLDLKLDLAGRGASLHEVMSTLSGRASLDLGEAIVRNENAAIALSDLGTLARGGGREGAKLRCAYGDFEVSKGVARPDALVVHLDTIALFGEGRINLGEERLKLEFDRVAQRTAASSVLPPFTLKGSLASPEAGIATGALLGKAVDLGGALLGDRAVEKGPQGSSCRELWAAYRAQRERREGTGDRAKERAGETGKKLIDSFKGLLD